MQQNTTQNQQGKGRLPLWATFLAISLVSWLGVIYVFIFEDHFRKAQLFQVLPLRWLNVIVMAVIVSLLTPLWLYKKKTDGIELALSWIAAAMGQLMVVNVLPNIPIIGWVFWLLKLVPSEALQVPPNYGAILVPNLLMIPVLWIWYARNKKKELQKD